MLFFNLVGKFSQIIFWADSRLHCRWTSMFRQFIILQDKARPRSSVFLRSRQDSPSYLALQKDHFGIVNQFDTNGNKDVWKCLGLSFSLILLEVLTRSFSRLTIFKLAIQHFRILYDSSAFFNTVRHSLGQFGIFQASSAFFKTVRHFPGRSVGILEDISKSAFFRSVRHFSGRFGIFQDGSAFFRTVSRHSWRHFEIHQDSSVFSQESLAFSRTVRHSSGQFGILQDGSAFFKTSRHASRQPTVLPRCWNYTGTIFEL